MLFLKFFNMLSPFLLNVSELYLWLSFFLIIDKSFNFTSNPLIPAADGVALLGYGDLLAVVILEIKNHLPKGDVFLEEPYGNFAVMKIIISTKPLFLHLHRIKLPIINESHPIFKSLFIGCYSTDKAIVFHGYVLALV